ncbi:Peptidase C39 [Paraburkholderia tropica]|uniref:peptidase C39 n=1 Tax=Paraburkholderia TaxID=1822464 RepID=UPI001CB40048|nr:MULTISPECIES: peptidase C39 [Paraburkholderia]CAG9223517.1 Peptidase C39 [Paraburkholderia tropica]
MNRNLSQCGIAAGICALACAYASGASAAESLAATQAATPAFLSAGGVDAQPVRCEPVGDDVLAHQSGKYAGSNMISGFVLTVLSQWQLPNGASAVAQGSLSVSQNTANQLSASVQSLAKVTDPVGTNAGNSGASPNASANGGQNLMINGVSQITQVAGNSNVGVNGATIDFANPAAQLAGQAGMNQSSASAQNANGTIRAGIAFGSNGINVTLQTPAGVATQNIVPSGAQQAGAIAQLLQIAGNNQKVANQLQLNLQTQQMSAQMIRQSGVLQALRNVR